jgi:hypothetical protein
VNSLGQNRVSLEGRKIPGGVAQAGDRQEILGKLSIPCVALLSLYSTECVEGDSQKLVCRMPHSPARWPPYGQPETSRLLKVNHYMLHVRMKMRLGGCAVSSQNTDADTGVGG